MRLFLSAYLLATFASLSLGDTLQAGSIVVGHQISAAGRQHEILRDERLFEHMAAVRLHDIARFDHAHPFYGQILGNSDSYGYYLQRWQSAPARFEFYHPLAWRILDGRAHVDEQLAEAAGQHVPEIPPLPPTPPTPPTPPADPRPGPTVEGAVPEPSSAVLMLASLGILVLARAAGWAGRR